MTERNFKISQIIQKVMYMLVALLNSGVCILINLNVIKYNSPFLISIGVLTSVCLGIAAKSESMGKLIVAFEDYKNSNNEKVDNILNMVSEMNTLLSTKGSARTCSIRMNEPQNIPIKQDTQPFYHENDDEREEVRGYYDKVNNEIVLIS